MNLRLIVAIGLLVSLAFCRRTRGRTTRLVPISHKWVDNTRYSEYRGVKVPELGQIGSGGSDLKVMLKKCNAEPSCQGVTETDKNKWHMVKRLALVSAPKTHRLWHKSGTRTVTQTTETKVITVSRWTDYAASGYNIWGEIKGYRFKQVYGDSGNLKDTMRSCKGERQCNGVSAIGGKWKKGKGRELIQGTVTWVVGSRMSRSGASRVQGSQGHHRGDDNWHRGHFAVNYPRT
eukprot:sb/3469342/